jgi:hypothetical protein
MTPKQINELIIAVNACGNLFKYPIGNKELTEKLKTLEAQGKIQFNTFTNTWEKKIR